MEKDRFGREKKPLLGMTYNLFIMDFRRLLNYSWCIIWSLLVRCLICPFYLFQRMTEFKKILNIGSHDPQIRTLNEKSLHKYLNALTSYYFLTKFKCSRQERKTIWAYYLRRLKKSRLFIRKVQVLDYKE